MTITPTGIYESLVDTGTSPAIVWHEPDGRVELSGKVFANHIAKIANYLEQECDLMPGSRVVLDLPTHWKSIAWALGGLMAGGFVVIGREKIHDCEPGTIIVTDTPDEVSADDADDLIVALNLDSFGFAWDGELPDGVADGAAEVIGQADVLLVEGLDEDSNASFWANVLGEVPEIERAVVAEPALAEAVALAYLQLGRAKSAVFIATGNADEQKIEQIAKAELGTVLNL